MSAPTGQHQYAAIELLRFLAATAVVFVHIPTVGVGHFGVDIFFAISGFVMMVSTQNTTHRFMLKRIIRIVPTYYFFTAGIFALAVVMPNLLNNTSANVGHLIKSLLFIPFDKNGVGHAPLLFLGWTLNYEMFFYALFALSLQLSQRYRGLICAGLLALVFVLCRNIESYPLTVYGNRIVFEFVLGIAIYEALVKKRGTHVLMLCSVVVLALMSAEHPGSERLLQFGIPSALFVGVTMIVLRHRRVPGIFMSLGGASYALYLTHPYVIQFFDKVTQWFSADLPRQALALVCSLLLVNALALAIYTLLELPVTSRLRERFV